MYIINKKIKNSFKKNEKLSCNLCGSKSSRLIFIKNGYNLVQCTSCGLVYVSNPPSKLELKKLYSFESNYHTEIQNESIDFEYWENRARKYYNLIKKYKARGRILDIGCSIGFFLKVVKENGWETHGVEISKDISDYARNKFGLDVFTGTIDEIKFPPKFFDVVTMWDFIEHVENPTQAMIITNKILKDDGILVLTTPNIDGLFPRLSYMVSKEINYWPHPEPPHHLFQFSKKTIYKLLNKTGFKILNIYDKRNPIYYLFGGFKSLFRSPYVFLYSAIFIPITLIGPIVHSGDWVMVIAEKSHDIVGEL